MTAIGFALFDTAIGTCGIAAAIIFASFSSGSDVSPYDDPLSICFATAARTGGGQCPAISGPYEHTKSM